MKQDEIIQRLIEALVFYAVPQYWTRVYGRYVHDQRMWIGPGNGAELAQRALQDVEEHLNEETNTLYRGGDALEKGGSDGK